MRRIETAEEAHTKFQESIINWGWLLIATGGTLKPIKCFFQLISFRWNHSGTWEYKDNKNHEEYKIVVPPEDGLFAKIQHLNIDTPMKILGSMTAPTGSNAGAIKQMKDKAKGWLAQATAGKLHHNFWF
jgi:hypothetical protein